MGEVKLTDLESFLARVEKKPNGCWEWVGARDTERGGYGHLTVRRRVYRAHRWMWQLTYGAAPAGFLCHRCDNPPCVNPTHMFVGDAGTNMRDCVAKGRWRPGHSSPKGSAHGMSKLTEEAVREIRRRAPRETREALGGEFGVSAHTVYGVIARRTWAHVE